MAFVFFYKWFVSKIKLPFNTLMLKMYGTIKEKTAGATVQQKTKFTAAGIHSEQQSVWLP